MPNSSRPGFVSQWQTAREASLGPGDEGVLVMESNRRLFRRWFAAGHGEWMVPRDAFDVIDLGDLVGSLCVHDRDEERDDYRCRVFGSAVADDLGVDMTGRLMSSYPERLRDAARVGYDRALASRRPFASVDVLVRTAGSDRFQRDGGRTVHERLILPVTRTGRGVDCFITHVARMPADALSGSLGIGGTKPGGTVC
jgi:hypothetical protein